MIQVGGTKLRSGIYRLVWCMWKKELLQQWKETITLSSHKRVVTIEECHYYQLQTQTKLLGIISVDFEVTEKLFIRYSAFVR